ncbi:hypothetical protein DNTS_021324 [Danionella cerebrum]|uniref:Cilia- and flagella-associated protein 418 n=1 Tax=Danionella cerebrum TaxID=2873325 RepID=A0A553MP03_9TELE|nr:hypothetical protein DNTS_021324 [Danionella translucida]
MADDLDNLLDEVETRFCCSTSRQTEQYHSENKVSRKQIIEGDDDIDAVLQEILNDDEEIRSKRQCTTARTAITGDCSQTMFNKCFPVFLGGSSFALGVGTSVSQRNNVPDCGKLRRHLRRRNGVRAYACQCSWISALTLTDLRDAPQVKWVCGKH